jgi:ribosomal peptide maturation radical SAM protein 1
MGPDELASRNDERVSPRPERVALVSMPFGPIERPSLALGLLQAHCRRLDVECETHYLAISFARHVGPAEYCWITDTVPYTVFAGDWAFAEALYGPRPAADARYVRDVLKSRWQMDAGDISRLQRIRKAVPEFLACCLEGIEWRQVTLVGFTSVFQQNLPSLALARRLKRRFPHLTIAFGGANWEEPMGSALHRQFPFVDLSFSGEADRSWPALLEARRRGRSPATIPGIESVPQPVEDLDELPVPDFDPYFEQLRSDQAMAGIRPALLVETARGCWWGERSQCTFCGLNGSSMGFRSKSPQRAVDEIVGLRRRHDVGTISVVDNILDMRYLRSVLPKLAEEPLHADLFWEVKANLTHHQVAQLRAAGVTFIQPGIESLSDHVLQLMRKGTTAARNIELLKWCAEYAVTPLWNLLYGFPGESAEDYRQTAEIIRSIWHLQPPTGYGPIRLDRFSPFHADPHAFGMVDVRPMDPLPDLYPFERSVQMETAYYFDFDYADGRAADAYARDAVRLAQEWMADRRRGSLWMRELETGLHLVDSRRELSETPRRAILRGWKAATFVACDRAQETEALRTLPEVGLAGVGLGELVGFLERAVALGMMIRLGGRWLNLAVHTPARPLEPRPTMPEEGALPLTLRRRRTAAARDASIGSPAG